MFLRLYVQEIIWRDNDYDIDNTTSSLNRVKQTWKFKELLIIFLFCKEISLYSDVNRFHIDGLFLYRLKTEKILIFWSCQGV